MNSGLKRRIERIEHKLGANREPKTVTIIKFGDELPPDRMEGNTTYRFVRYDERAAK